MEVDFFTWTGKSKFCLKTRSEAIPGWLPSSRTLGRAKDTPSLMKFRRLRPENKQFEVFMVHSYVVIPRVLTCNHLLYESNGAETLVDGLPRPASAN